MSDDTIHQDFRIRPAIALLVLFASGIALDRFLNLPWRFCLVVAVLAIIGWFLCFRFGKSKWALLLLAIGVVGTGAFWHHGRWNWFGCQEIAACCQDEAKAVIVRGQILGEPRFSAKSSDSVFDPMPKRERTSFRFLPHEIRNGDQWEPVTGLTALVVHDAAPRFGFGDVVEVVGKLVAIGKPSSPGQFDFQDYSRAGGQLTSLHAMHSESVRLVRRAGRFSNAAVLSGLRYRLDQLVQQHVGGGQAGFASAILLGNREQLNPEQRDVFLVTGTAHLLAISGLHIGILASMFLFLYRFGAINRRWALLLTIVFVIFYCWLVEYRPPVLRATVLLVLFCIGRLVGRSGSEFNLVALAGMVVLFINPSDLFQLGPQLSFLAFVTLIVFKDWIFPPLSQDPIDRLVRNSRPPAVRFANQLFKTGKQMFLVSALIWLIGLPLVAAKFHLVTPVAILINPFVLLPLAIGLFAGMGVCLAGGFAPGLADVCGWVCSESLGLVTHSIEMASGISGSHWWTAGPTLTGVVLFYLLLLCAVLWLGEYRQRAIVAGWAVLIFLAWLFPFQLDKFIDRNWRSDFQCTFIDVGHGSSVLIETGDGRNMLYDAGSLTSARFATTTISSILWSKQIEHLDAIVVSHADLDHFNAVPQLVERFSVGVVYVGYPMLESESDSVSELLNRLNLAKIDVRTLAWDDRVSLGDRSVIKVLLPPEFGTGDGDNSNSVVLSIQANGFTTLLSGDLEKSGMQLLLGQSPLDCDVVMMPHHGSKNSRPVEFLEWTTPEHAIVCASMSKLDNHVIHQIEDRGCRSLSTAAFGTVQVRFSDGHIRLAHWDDDRWLELK